MAKQKIKRSIFDTLCTEVAPCVWEWETQAAGQSLKWQYQDSTGLNTFAVVPGKIIPIAFFAKLDIAVAYTLGYTTGMYNPRNQSATT